MKKLPKSVTIGGHHITIKAVKRKISLNGQQAWGIYKYLENEIVLWTGAAWTKQEETFLHECLHAISDEYGINLSEKQVTHLTKALYAFQKTNNIVFSHDHDKPYKKK